jgi:hypothetical protein
MNRENVRALGARIFNATMQGNETMSETFEALLEVFLFYMSTVCPDCRRHIAAELQRRIPGMLTVADRAAVALKDRFGKPGATAH